MRYYGDAVQFENEDVAYRAWIDGNAHGFVVNSCAKPSPDYLKMHRACCPSISRPDRDIWTSGQYIKTCSADRASLESWARDHVLGTCTSGCHCMGGRAGQAAVVSDSHHYSALLNPVHIGHQYQGYR